MTDVNETNRKPDAEFGDTTHDSVSTDEQNNNEINLTSLVEDGTFTSILDAIANADQVSAPGNRLIIEPGVYQADTQRTLTYSDREISAYGTGHVWNTNGDTLPVVIEWTGSTGGGERMLTIGDGSTLVEGLKFGGIEFQPQTKKDAITGVYYDTSTSGGQARDITWERCAWRFFGNEPIGNASATPTFDIKYHNCSWYQNDVVASLGVQATVWGGYFSPSQGSNGLKIGTKSLVFGVRADIQDNSVAIEARDNSLIMPGNLEAQSSPGSIGITVTAAPGAPVSISGTFDGFETGVRVDDGPIYLDAKFPNINGNMVEFTGGNNAHNGYLLQGNYAPTQIQFDSFLQQGLILSSNELQNASESELVPGWFGIDTDRNGTGTTAIVYGEGITSTTKYAYYWDNDGRL